MAWRGNLSRSLKELRVLFSQKSPASAQTREFVEKNYQDLKKLNPKFPILIRKCSGVEPQLWARYDFRPPFITSHSFSTGLSHMPTITDQDINHAFKELMAANWDELPNAVIQDTESALSKTTDDKSGQESLTNVFRAAKAVEQFGGMLISMKMELDDSVGLSGENVHPLSEDFVNALRVAHEKYVKYLDSFGVDETYLRKKVENELGTKMIYLKMRCSGLGSEWGKVSLLGTSGLSGSYVEQRG